MSFCFKLQSLFPKFVEWSLCAWGMGQMGQFFDNRLRKIVMVSCRKVNNYILQKMCEVHGSYLADILDAEENRFIVSLMHHTQSDLKI